MRSKLTGYFIGGFAMIVIWMLAIFQPTYKEYKETATQVSEAEQKLQDFQSTIMLLPQMVKTREELSKRKERINSSLYTKENIISLFKSFTSLAKQNKVDIVEITPPIEELLKINRVTPDSSQLMFLNISLRIEGDYRDFGRFVSSLEQQEYYRGPNHCNIVSTYDRRSPIQYHLGFKSLLGSLKDEV